MLEIDGVRKTYPGADGGHAVVLDDVTLTVPDRQFVSLLGSSGCGKTTLMRIVAGLTKAEGGQVRLDDTIVRGPGQDRSIVFQNYGLLPWRSVLANVEFGLEIRGVAAAERRKVARDYIQRVGLDGFESHYPHQISGGMQQRVALARAFSKQPRLLLMDEPFAAVDMQTRERLQDELLQIWMSMRTTVLFVTHSIDEAIYLGDRVIVMGARPGRVVADVQTELPRPRTSAGDVKDSSRFIELRSFCRHALSGTAMAAA